MSNSNAIAAVTEALRSHLDKWIQSDLLSNADPFADLSNVVITTLPPDLAADEATTSLNLFLYQVNYNAEWTNLDPASIGSAGQTESPPLALTLNYLLTAYPKNKDVIVAHRLLGQAMSILHDYPLLGRDQVRHILSNATGNNISGDQIERMRITPLHLSVEELSKLWSAFASKYRISVAYQVSVVLIESRRSPRSVLPVLTIGKNDTGVISYPNLLPPLPFVMSMAAIRAEADGSITELKKKPAVEVGDLLRLSGYHLDGSGITVRFVNPSLAAPVSVVPQPGGTDTQMDTLLDTALTDWIAGQYNVEAELTLPAETSARITNRLPLTVAPKIVTPVAPVVRAADGSATITVGCSPRVLPEQKAELLIDNQVVQANARALETDPLVFVVTPEAAGTFTIRLRVDGVESLPVVDYAAVIPVFDPNQTVVIT